MQTRGSTNKSPIKLSMQQKIKNTVICFLDCRNLGMESLRQRFEHLSPNLRFKNGYSKIESWVYYILELGIELIERLILLHLNLFEACSKPLQLQILDNLGPSQVVQRMVHASFAVSVEDILLNSLLVTALNKAFNALLLKFATLILASSQSTGTSFGLVQPISTICHTFSSRDCKKVLMRTFQFAQLVPSNKGGMIKDCPLSMTNRGQWINTTKIKT